MGAFVYYLMFVMVFKHLHRRTEAVYSADMNRVLATFNRSYDNCKDVTDSSGHEGRAAADSACEEAFKALDRIGMNACWGWQTAKCDVIGDDKQAQCTCKVPTRNDYSKKSYILTAFRECARDLRDQEASTGTTAAPTATFQQIRSDYDDAWLAASWLDTSYAYPYEETGDPIGVYTSENVGAGGDVYTTSGVGTSEGVYTTGSQSVAYNTDGAGSSWDLYPERPPGYELAGAYSSHIPDPNPEYPPGYEIAGAYPSYIPESTITRTSETVSGQTDADHNKQYRPYSCDQCDGKYRSARTLFEHKRVHHTMSDNFCYICDTSYGYRRTFMAHLRKEHPEVAKAEEESRQNMADSIEVQNVMPFACVFCKKRFTLRKNLNCHLKSHTTDGTKCPRCHLKLSSRDSMKSHMKTWHPKAPIPEAEKVVRNGPFVCKLCGNPYNSAHSLKEHEKSHQGQRTHCIHCNKTLSTTNNYRQHMERKHPKEAMAEREAKRKREIEEKPEKCEKCPKRFKTAKNLKEHYEAHERSACDECPKVFQRKATLEAHKKKDHPKKDQPKKDHPKKDHTKKDHPK